MNFPHIRTIDDILEYIEGCPEFAVMAKGDYTVIDYIVQTHNTFVGKSLYYRRECRGIIFGPDGTLISRPLHKFKNLNESEEVLIRNIDFTRPFVVLDKLDGSMLRPIRLTEGIRWATRKGITDVALHAESFVSRNSRYEDFSRKIINANLTPVFEFVSPVRGVVQYDHDDMILLAIRDNFSGKYLSYREMIEHAGEFDIPVVKMYETPDDIEEFVARAREEQGNEGYIIRFNDGEMIKVKNDWYVCLHRIRSTIENDHEIILRSINGTLDDIKAAFGGERQRIEEVESNFWNLVARKKEIVEEKFRTYMSLTDGDVREFAIQHANNLHPIDRALIFQMWKGKDIHDSLIDLCTRNLGKQKTYHELMDYLRSD